MNIKILTFMVLLFSSNSNPMEQKIIEKSKEKIYDWAQFTKTFAPVTLKKTFNEKIKEIIKNYTFDRGNRVHAFKLNNVPARKFGTTTIVEVLIAICNLRERKVFPYRRFSDTIVSTLSRNNPGTKSNYYLNQLITVNNDLAGTIDEKLLLERCKSGIQSIRGDITKICGTKDKPNKDNINEFADVHYCIIFREKRFPDPPMALLTENEQNFLKFRVSMDGSIGELRSVEVDPDEQRSTLQGKTLMDLFITFLSLLKPKEIYLDDNTNVNIVKKGSKMLGILGAQQIEGNYQLRYYRYMIEGKESWYKNFGFNYFDTITGKTYLSDPVKEAIQTFLNINIPENPYYDNTINAMLTKLKDEFTKKYKEKKLGTFLTYLFKIDTDGSSRMPLAWFDRIINFYLKAALASGKLSKNAFDDIMLKRYMVRKNW